jgi:hypothetical protein
MYGYSWKVDFWVKQPFPYLWTDQFTWDCLSPDDEGSFQRFNVIKFVYYVPKKHGLVGSGIWIPLVLNPTTLDM